MRAASAALGLVLLACAGCAGARAAGGAATSAGTLPASAEAAPQADASAEAAETGAPALVLSHPPAGQGRVRLECRPADADVRVDGVTQGRAADFAAPGGLDLPPGLHRIEVSKTGYVTHRTEVVVSEEVTTTIPVTLRPLPARAAKEGEP